MREVEVAIIGAGTAGLSARTEVAKLTDDYLVLDGGALGTTCARVGCMPSKALIQVAEDFHRRGALAAMGITGGEGLGLDGARVMAEVRAIRDRLVGAVLEGMESWRDEKLIRASARFIAPGLLEADGEPIRARRVIIATGSRPVFPEAWREHARYFLDTDGVFELETLPEKLAVIGLGAIGIELGQAFSRLGVEVFAVGRSESFGGLADPEVRNEARKLIGGELTLSMEGAEIIGPRDGRLVVAAGERRFAADKVLLALGRRPALEALDLEAAGVALDDDGLPDFDRQTLRIADSELFLAGDGNGERSILHEASDEGRIAGYNAVRDEERAFRRRVPLAVIFSDPCIARVGRDRRQLEEEGRPFVTGAASFEGQGRAILMRREGGLAKVYADRASGALLGAELVAPHGEHLAHLLAWAIAKEASLDELMSFPFYHPTLEEGLRSAFRRARRATDRGAPPLDTPLAGETP